MEQFIQDHVVDHWPFFAVIFIVMIIMQVVKTSVFTKKRAYTKGRAQWFWWWGYKLLALQSVVLGALVGTVWTNPEPDISGPAAIGYFAFAGSLAVFAYEILKGLAKKRNIDLTLPGQSITPSDPEQD